MALRQHVREPDSLGGADADAIQQRRGHAVWIDRFAAAALPAADWQKFRPEACILGEVCTKMNESNHKR